MVRRFRRWVAGIRWPNLSGCGRCGRVFWRDRESWLSAIEHITRLSPTVGCFPLCERCWSSMTPEQRVPYYRELWDRWNTGGFWIQWADGTWHLWSAPEPWPEIEAAVLNETGAGDEIKTPPPVGHPAGLIHTVVTPPERPSDAEAKK